MSEKEETKSNIENVTDEDFAVFMKALFENYKGPAYNPE